VVRYCCEKIIEVRGMSGEKIRALRKKAGMTQTELSEKLNSEYGLKTDRVMISKWETGFQTPVVSTLSCIAKVFGVTLDYLNGAENNDMNNIEAAKVALFSGASEVTDEMWQEVVNFAKYIEAREAAKNENN
jgi:transcriptional regulator with XRE-family HTH domain